MDAYEISHLLSRATAEKRAYYEYTPSKPLAIVATVLYGLTFGAHAFQLVRYRTWYFAAIAIAAQMEVMGYAARILSAGDVHNRNLFIISFTLIVLAPIMIAAGCYIVLGRLLESVLPGGRNARALGVRARWVTVIFIASDIFSFALQGGGAAIMSSGSGGATASDRDKLNLGKKIMLIGLAVQLGFFAFFTAAVVRFDTKTKEVTAEAGGRPKWRALVWALYLACFLILVRSVFRVAEFSQGWDGYLASHEVFFYTLEALPMLPCLAIFNFIHPGKYIVPRPESATPTVSDDSTKERV